MAFEIDKNSYLAFDGKSIRDIVIDKLNQDGYFTDQNYQGSNLSAFIDVISYTFSTLLYYLNKTSSESMFSEAQIYENMNRIIKLLNYKPIGKIGQSVPIKISSNFLPKGNFIIPRYSYIKVGNVNFSFTEDIPFTKTIDGFSNISDIDNKYNLKQGLFVEYPPYIASGIDNEIVFIPTQNTPIDHFNIDVYVKRENSDVWEKWEKSNELFTKKANGKYYEVRYNHNKNYEIRFGDDINGSKLNKNDIVSIFYLKIDVDSLSIGSNTLRNNEIIKYNSVLFSEIFANTSIEFGSYLTSDTLKFIYLDNDYSSTRYSEEESVDSIRRNAPKNFRTQNRLVTTLDFDTYIRTNFSNILADLKVVNNDEYLNTYMKYLYNIGLKNPQLDNAVLYNQIKFSSSCNFNNVYFYPVPKSDSQEYLTPSQKEYILESLEELKILTSNVVPIDPIYMYFDFYVPLKETLLSDKENTKLYIYKSPNSRRASSAIKFDVETIIKKYFSNSNNKLGEKINTNQINSDILSIDGVVSVETRRTDEDVKIDGLSFIVWNPIYPELDVKNYTQNIVLENFQFAKFNDIENVNSRIIIVEDTNYIKSTEF